MNSLSTIFVPSAILQCPTKSSLLRNNEHRPRRTNGLPTKENPQPDKRFVGKSRVNATVQRIKALTPRQRNDIIVSELERTGDWDAIVEFNDLLRALLIAGESELALKLFDEMPSRNLAPNSLTLSLSIRCHCKNYDFEEAERVFEHVLENGLQPDHGTISFLIDSLSKRGKLTRALSVLDKMVKTVGFNPRVQTYNSLLKGLCYVGRIDDAIDMLTGMKKRDGLDKPDVFSYTALTNGLCKVGRSDEAFELLKEGLEEGIEPDVVAFNGLFHGYCVEGRPKNGIRVLKLMKERGLVPDEITYNTFLYGLLKWRCFEAAFRVYDEMVGVGFRAEDKTLNALLIGLCRKFSKGEKRYLDVVRELFERMKRDGSVVNGSSYDVMVQTLCAGTKPNEANVNLQEMIKMGYSPRTVTSNGVIRALCGEGKVTEALFLLILLNESGRVPGRMCYELLIHELNKTEQIFGARSLYGAAVKRGIISSMEPL